MSGFWLEEPTKNGLYWMAEGEYVTLVCIRKIGKDFCDVTDDLIDGNSLCCDVYIDDSHRYKYIGTIRECLGDKPESPLRLR